MEIGKVPENVLKRAVFKQIKHLRPEVLLHPGVGEDCSAIETAEDEIDRVKEILTEGMQQAADLKVALAIDLHTGTYHCQ